MEEAAKLLREAAEEIEKTDFYHLEFEIKLKLQRPTSTLILNTELREKLPPSK